MLYEIQIRAHGWPRNRSHGFALEVNLIEHIWDISGRRIQVREPHVQNFRQLEEALHRAWQQLSQQDIPHLTGGMRCKVEAVIQARGGYTRYGRRLLILNDEAWRCLPYTQAL
jgi:isopentenyl phosphate kinase